MRIKTKRDGMKEGKGMEEEKLRKRIDGKGRDMRGEKEGKER